MRIALQVACENRTDLPSRGALSRWANTAARCSTHAVPAGWELTVRLVDSAESARLNREFRGKPGATNVLSFPFEQPPGVTIPLLGDVVVCVPVVRAEAGEQHKPLVSHFAHMMVHSTLHLLGYDHGNDDDAQLMEALEARVMVRLGFEDPYLFQSGPQQQG